MAACRWTVDQVALDTTMVNKSEERPAGKGSLDIEEEYWEMDLWNFKWEYLDL